MATDNTTGGGNGNGLVLTTKVTSHDPDDHRKRSLRGTGGTALIPFLKQVRDEMGESALGP